MKPKHTLPNNYPPQLKAKFLKRISKYNLPGPKGRCWEWQGAKAFYNYGYIRWGLGLYRTHRLAWEVWKSPIPDDMFVLHHCDNPCCVNPEHLFLGDQADNMTDRQSKGRGNQAKGEEQGHSKLTDEQVKEIRKLYDDGILNQYELAAKFGVRQPTICRLLKKETWK